MSLSSSSAELPAGTKIAVVGGSKSFSAEAAQLLIGQREGIDIVPYATMRDVTRSIRDGCKALIPWVNYSSSYERGNLDTLFSGRVRVEGESLLNVDMWIGGKGAEAAAGDLDGVHSKDVALAQCREYLDETYLDAQWHEESSTVAGAKRVAESQDLRKAALASRQALEAHGLEPWRNRISNAERRGGRNGTHFVLVSQGNELAPHEDPVPHFDPEKRFHGFIITPQDQPGTTRRITSILADTGMNLFAQPESPYDVLKYRFLYMFERCNPRADVRTTIRALMNIPQANGHYPLIQPLGSWDLRAVDPRLTS